jgi:hypothetical protein
LLRDIELDTLLESAGKEMKLPVAALQVWIGLYADRCEHKYHRAGFAELLELHYRWRQGSDFGRYNGTRRSHSLHMEYFIPHIRVAVMSFRDDLFEFITKDEWVLIKQCYGKKMAKLLKPVT